MLTRTKERSIERHFCLLASTTTALHYLIVQPNAMSSSLLLRRSIVSASSSPSLLPSLLTSTYHHQHLARAFSSAAAHSRTLEPSTYEKSRAANASSSAAAADTKALMSDDAEYILGTYARFPQLFVRGDGCYLYDTDGRQYLDFYAGIAVTALGHSDEAWQAAIVRQTHQLVHTANLYYSQPQIELAKRLIHVSNGTFQKVFFCNSGTEANEAALKFARKFAYIHTNADADANRPNKKTKFIAFNGAFHGRTIGALSLTYKRAYKTPFEPIMPNVVSIDYNDVAAVKSAVDEHTAAVFVEPVQGEGGVFPATLEFMKAIREACDKHNALMIADEVQCGLGRCGELWAHSAYGVQPDIMTLAKPLANGLPIGAVLVKQRVAETLKPGDHGSTFAGNPLCTAAADAVLTKISNPQFLQSVQHKGKLIYSLLGQLRDKLKTENSKDQIQITDIRSLNGQSLLIGVDVNAPVKDIIVDASQQHSLLLISGGEKTIRLCPPLIVDEEQIRTAVKVLEQLLLGRSAAAA